MSVRSFLILVYLAPIACGRDLAVPSRDTADVVVATADSLAHELHAPASLVSPYPLVAFQPPVEARQALPPVGHQRGLWSDVVLSRIEQTPLRLGPRHLPAGCTPGPFCMTSAGGLPIISLSQPEFRGDTAIVQSEVFAYLHSGWVEQTVDEWRLLRRAGRWRVVASRPVMRT
jgi:hypothetical protein